MVSLFNSEGDDYMILELEKEMSKVPSLKETIKEMGASLWQGSFRKTIKRIRTSNAGKWILGRYKKSRRSYKGK